MDDKLQTVLKEYIREVEEVCGILIKGINFSENLKLKSKKDFFDYRAHYKKMEFNVESICYKLHGKGCIAFSEERFWDWDFGYRSRWCGINPWKVSATLKRNKSPYIQYYEGSVLQVLCDQYVNEGIMFKWNDQYYFEMPKDETFQPKFPEEYDTLIIKYGDLQWSIVRNKDIDRFIRKSTRIHKQIDRYEDNYLLKFLLNEKECCCIPYNDISYPESAVKIMSDHIIKNLLK